GLVGVLRAIIQIPVLAMFYSRKNLSLGGPVALQLIGDDHPRYVRHSFEQLAEELLRRSLVPPTLHENVQHVALLIHSPPQVVVLALDGQKHLIHVPLVTRPGAAATELIGIFLAKLTAPLANSLVGDDDSAFQQYLVVYGNRAANSSRLETR